MNAFQKNGKEYRNGMHHAKNDRYECGESYVNALTHSTKGTRTIIIAIVANGKSMGSGSPTLFFCVVLENFERKK